MSTLHLRQICNYLENNYFMDVFLTEDELRKPPAEIQNLKYTRSLVAFIISMVSGVTPAIACENITDGFDDNGIDGIFYNTDEKCLYIIQSKYHSNGNGSIDTGELHKFIQGIKDLVSTRYEKFNNRIRSRSSEIEDCLLDAQTKFALILVHTGKDQISRHCNSIINDFLEDYNDISEIFTFATYDQRQIHTYISVGAEGSPINMDLLIHNWGDIKEPLKAFYGQIAASDLANWYNDNGRQLFSPNIRVYLGETDVNDGIIETIDNSPEFFWYFNNGITALCDKIDKKPIGGTGHETGIFECTNLKIVNGAQTVGTIHSLLRKNPENLEKTRVWIRIISLESAEEGLVKNITKTNNTQNRIEKRDFVSLDPEQKRLHDEFNIENLVYLYKSGELRGEEEGLDLVEATVARACVQDDIQYTYQAKREISKLWDDIEKPPYKILFNSSIQSLRLWREVQVLRIVEKFVADQKRILDGRDKLMVTHGNRFLLHLIFREIGEKVYTSDEAIKEENILDKCHSLFTRLNKKVNELYPESVLGSLFKNLTKCRHIKEDL